MSAAEEALKLVTESALSLFRMALDVLFARGVPAEDLHKIVDEGAVKRAHEAHQKSDDEKFGKDGE